MNNIDLYNSVSKIGVLSIFLDTAIRILLIILIISLIILTWKYIGNRFK